MKKKGTHIDIGEAQAFPADDKDPRAAALLKVNKNLALQNKEKEQYAAELAVINKELLLQNVEKEKLTAELFAANSELAFRNQEKSKHAAELVIANRELAFQNEEKEKRAAELIVANKELVFQNREKEMRAAELLIANKELESFAFISSHDLQEPLRKIQAFSDRILTNEYENLSIKGKYYFERIQSSASYMQALINDLLAYSRTTATERVFEHASLNKIITEVMAALKDELKQKKATVEIGKLCEVYIIPFQFRQLLQNLMSNALKFSRPAERPHILIRCEFVRYDKSLKANMMLPRNYFHISFSDNGIGFDPEYKDKIFEIFQRLHNNEDYEGTGIGLTIVRKIVDNHRGIITATGEPGKGAAFDIYIPAQQK